MVVDDEILVRVGVKTFVPWEQLGLRLIGEAANGKEALELIRKEGCDILLTDIQMPEMNGLELLEIAHREYPHIKAIILSNYQEFHYVRKAMQLGAADYLLKLTMEPQEMEQKLLELKEKILAERSLQHFQQELKRELNLNVRAAREQLFRDILTKQCSKREIRECLSAFGYESGSRPFYLSQIKISRYEQVLAENKYKSEKLLMYSVANVLQEIIRKHGRGELIELDNGCFALFTAWEPSSVLQEMRESIKHYLHLDLCQGVSDPCHDEELIHQAFEQAELAVDASFYEGAGRVYAYSQVSHREAEAEALSVPYERMNRLIDHREYAGLQDLVSEWLQSIGEKRYWTSERIKESAIQLVNYLAVLLTGHKGDIYSIPSYQGHYPHHAIRTAETLEEMSHWIESWIPFYIDYLKDHAQLRLRPEIQSVIRLIRERYDTALKVSDLARELGFNEAYLSTLFKKETGETIMDLIIRLRMEKARSLLKEPGVKVYEVSEAVGYSDANYFSKLFKKIEGILPQEYHKRYAGK